MNMRWPGRVPTNPEQHSKTVRLTEKPTTTMKEAINDLMPPGTSAVTRYRITTSAVLLSTLFLVMAGFGAFRWLGYAGFAQAADLENRVSSVTQDLASVKADVKDIKSSLLERAIYDAKRLSCQSSAGSESERFYEQQVARMHRDYFALTGVLLPIPECKTVNP